MATAFLLNFVRFLVIALELLILGRVLISWTDPTGRGSLARFLIEVTEPILAPVRRVLPQTGMIDWSPVVVLVVLGMIIRII